MRSKHIAFIIILLLLITCSSASAADIHPIDFNNQDVTWTGVRDIYSVTGDTAWDVFKTCMRGKNGNSLERESCVVVPVFVRVSLIKTVSCIFILSPSL
jgi:hypothetical protein